MSVLAVPLPITLEVPLEDRAIIARLHIRRPSFRKTDSKIARRVADETGSRPEMHSHRRRLLAASALAKIQSIVSAAEVYHQENTSPWQNKGVRILNTQMFDQYMEKMRAFERQYNAAVAEFIPAYPALIEEARPMLGDSFNERDYPHPMRIAEKFSFEIEIESVTTDFRCGSLSAADQERIQQEIEARTQRALQEVTRDLHEQMLGHVEHMVERLVAYEEREAKPEEEKDKTGIFRDSLVNNIKEFVERLPKLNLTGDPKVEELRQRVLRTLCAHTAEDLRKSPLTRQQVLGQAKAIRDAVSELI